MIETQIHKYTVYFLVLLGQRMCQATKKLSSSPNLAESSEIFFYLILYLTVSLKSGPVGRLVCGLWGISVLAPISSEVPL